MPATGTLSCRPLGQWRQVVVDGDTLLVRDDSVGTHSRWRLRGETAAHAQLAGGDGARLPDALAALEAAFTLQPALSAIALDAGIAALLNEGYALPGEHGGAVVHADLFWQQAAIWTNAAAPLPLQYRMTQNRRHPLRAAKPAGTVYRRYIPWLARTLSFRRVDIEQDLPLFNRWMNDPFVARFWREEGDLAAHRAYLQRLEAEPRVTPLLACFDDAPFAYFETYWAKEDHIAPYCDAADWDRGWHVLVGESSFRGREFVSAWMPSMSHYLFLDDCRTQRLVIEPRADNARMIRSLAASGWSSIKEFDFPHKRALLCTLSRERYFGERLWQPRGRAHD